MSIQWKKGASFKLDADVAYTQVEIVRKKHKGNATAEQVLKAATAKRNPLHREFEWDDTVAAHQHRLECVRNMMRSFVIVRNDIKTERPQRAYEVIRQPQEKPRERPKYAYKTVDEIMADKDLRAELLHRALRELISVRDRYRDLQELAVVIRAIDEVLEEIEV